MIIPKSKSKHNSDLRMQKLECARTYAAALNCVSGLRMISFLLLRTMTAACVLREVDAARDLAQKNQHLIA